MTKLYRQIKAKLMGTWVADCPVCHNHFYGNTNYGWQVRLKGKHYRIACPDCKHSTKPND